MSEYFMTYKNYKAAMKENNKSFQSLCIHEYKQVRTFIRS